jgi:hypothetical protein
MASNSALLCMQPHDKLQSHLEHECCHRGKQSWLQNRAQNEQLGVLTILALIGSSRECEEYRTRVEEPSRARVNKVGTLKKQADVQPQERLARWYLNQDSATNVKGCEMQQSRAITCIDSSSVPQFGNTLLEGLWTTLGCRCEHQLLQQAAAIV